MEQYLFHTNLEIPILSLINGLVLLSRGCIIFLPLNSPDIILINLLL